MNPLEFIRWLINLRNQLAELVKKGEMTESQANDILKKASQGQEREVGE